ncbi:unnamed protein product [Thelazia callipaeda]|uniref:PIEZO domain-containing protein n=1 Tax=Thelazia callipaeda TaxID=103827 RepID=A0A0N5DC76_THECL|nr:unnamed protein product [Thelazia callipaeda]
MIICLLLSRWRVRRVYLIFVCYHLLVLIYSFIAYIGPLPGKCYDIILFESFANLSNICVLSSGSSLLPDHALYFALINNGQYTISLQEKSSDAIYCYFLNVIFAIIQYQNFKTENAVRDNAQGGSNDGILLALHRQESLDQNPVPDFFSANVKVLDELKQVVCSYFHWIVLLIILLNGIRLSSSIFLSVILIILAFINLWSGADLYLSHPTIFIQKWRLITIYLLSSIFLRIVALISDVVLGYILIRKNKEHYYMSVHVLLTYFANFEGNDTKSYGALKTDNFLFDLLTFTVLLLHLRLISSWHFQRTVIDIRADRIVCYRGVILQTQLIYKAMTYNQQQERRRLTKIKHIKEKIEKLSLPLGKWFIECIFLSIRGWNENLLQAADIMSVDSEKTFRANLMSTSDNANRAQKTKEESSFITLSVLFSKCALWFARKTLDYRYIRHVISKEKKLLLDKLPKELSLALPNSLAKLEKCNLGNEICLVTTSQDIVKYMTEVHCYWLKLPLLWRLLNSIGTFVIINTAFLCFLVIIIAHGQTASLLTFPLAILVFFWGALSERNHRLLWTIAIFYVQIMIVISLCSKYTSLPRLCDRDLMNCDRWGMAMVVRFVGIADEPISVAIFCLLALALFTHRHNMRVTFTSYT